MCREREVDDMFKNRFVEAVDMPALARAIAQGGGGGGKGGIRGRGGAGGRNSILGDVASMVGGAAAATEVDVNGTGVAVGGEAEKKPGAAPAELLPESTVAKQAGKLIKRHPESEILQRLLLQITNPRTPESDKQSLLALMNVEVAELDGGEDDD